MKRFCFVVLIIFLSKNAYAGFSSFDRAKTCTVTTSAISAYLGFLYDRGEDISFEKVGFYKDWVEKFNNSYIVHYLAQDIQDIKSMGANKKSVVKLTEKIKKSAEVIVKKRDLLVDRLVTQEAYKQTTVFENLFSRFKKCVREFDVAEKPSS